MPEGRWVTINGAHVFVNDKGDAILGLGKPLEGNTEKTEKDFATDRVKEAIRRYSENPYHFGVLSTYEQEEKERTRLKKDILAAGGKIKKEEDGSYKAFMPGMSFVETQAMNNLMNDGLSKVETKDYMEYCKATGQKPLFHEEKKNISYGIVKPPKDSSVVVLNNAEAFNILSDDEILEYSGNNSDIGGEVYREYTSENKEYLSSLSDKEVGAINSYTSEYGPAPYSAVNEYLRSGEVDSSRPIIPENSGLLQKTLDHPIGANVTVYRGTDGSPFGEIPGVSQAIQQVAQGNMTNAGKIKDALEGKTFTEKGFMSTSNYSSPGTYGRRPVQMVILASKEAKGVDISSLSKYGQNAAESWGQLAYFMAPGGVQVESEVLFNAGTKYKIESVTFSTRPNGRKQGGTTVIKARIIT